MPDNSLQLTGTVELCAAKQDAGDGPRKFLLIANTGSPMMVGNFFDPLILDISGAKFDKKKTPVIADHNTALRIGHTIEQAVISAGGEATLNGKTIKGPAIAAIGVVSSSMKIADGFVSDSQAGFPFQVSVGADLIAPPEFIAEGEKVEVNGKTYKGPINVARKTLHRELSITVLGADRNTAASLAASRSQKPLEAKDSEMTFEKWLEAEFGFTSGVPAGADETKLRARWEADKDSQKNEVKADADGTDIQARLREERELRAKEDERCDAIRSVYERFKDEQFKDDFDVLKAKQEAIRDGATPDSYELKCLRNRAEAASPAVHVPSIGASNLHDVGHNAIALSIIKAVGTVPANQERIKANGMPVGNGKPWGYEHWYSQKDLEHSDHPELRNMTFHKLLHLICRWLGRPTWEHGTGLVSAARDAMRNPGHIVAAGMSTLGVTNIFDDLANKMSLAGYEAVNATWREICSVRAVNDFKTHNLYAHLWKGGYKKIRGDGVIQHGEVSDSKYTHAAETYAKMYGFTRTDMINDDLGKLSQVLMGLGDEDARTKEELAYVTWLNGVGSTWVAGNNNLITGATSDLTVTGLTNAEQKFRDQTKDGAPILINPDRILVGTQDAVQADDLFTKTGVRPGPGSSSTDEQFTENTMRGRYRPIVSGYLNNTGITQRIPDDKAAGLGTAIPNQSTDQWFMLANPNIPQGATMVASLLNGREQPFLENADSNFDQLGMLWRAYSDFGFDRAVPELSVRAAGA